MKKIQFVTSSLTAISVLLLPVVAHGQAQSPASKPKTSTNPMSLVVGMNLTMLPDPVRPIGPTEMDKTIAHGETQLKAGDTAGAVATFQVAVDIDPHDGLALQRLAEAYAAHGQTDQALATYRTLVYHVPGQTWANSNANSQDVLMRFALLLDQAGHTQEALTAYNRGVGFLDYEHLTGQPRQKALLPQIGDGPGQQPYTPRGLAAMAHLAIGVDASGLDIAQIRMAVELAPDSAQARFYLGEYLLGIDDVGAKAALTRAAQSGDARTVAAAKEYLSVLH